MIKLSVVWLLNLRLRVWVSISHMGRRIVKYAINIFEYNMHLHESEKIKKEGECHQKKRRRSSIVYRCGVKNYKNITSNTEN